MSNHMTVANTILNQFGSKRSFAMIGGYNPLARNEGEGALSFRFKAEAKNSANFCKITLMPDDTYTVEFGRVHGVYKVISTHSEIYCDMLMDLFEQETGLYLTFNRRD